MAHYHDPPVTGHVHGMYARDSFFFVAEEELAVRHQPIPYPWCWSSCVFCFSCFRHSHVFPYDVPVLPLRAFGSRVVTILQPIWPLLWSCMILATCSRESHTCVFSLVKTQANPLGGWWTMPDCRRSLSGGSRCTASRSWSFGSSFGIVF